MVNVISGMIFLLVEPCVHELGCPSDASADEFSQTETSPYPAASRNPQG